jgi:multiple sugar transport system substrate-binding protein
VVVDSEAAVRALEYMRDAIHAHGIVPAAVLTWHEEEARFAFQNGDAVLMRNWPYAYTLLQSDDSRVADRFAVAPMPAAPGGTPSAALGGAQLAVNAHSRQPGLAWELIDYLTAPEQMLERARAVGQFPARHGVYDDPALEAALGVPAAAAREIILRAVPRPVTPVYTQLSEILQIRLHRALTRQQEPRDALGEAAREMRALLARTGLLGRTAGTR